MSRQNVALLSSSPSLEEVLARAGLNLSKLAGADGAQLANHANSTVPASATLSNTAAGYATLGGKFKFAAVAGAETDYALFAYQVPAGKRLFVKEVAISVVNTGAAVATTAHILEWALGLNSTAVSLATSDADPVFGPRRVPIGQQALLASAAIGAMPPDLVRKFDTPLVVESLRYLHTILSMPVATATGSQIIRGVVQFSGHWG
jgi:hypothetical protein